ncbi:hypothetical protein [Haloarcula marina]|uniref:hypothetical protein n=1 Tax=Haloarcula marina TaxID=2961574 RepID=UPI0020B65C89|nr:hypothetical protein [Halomicroarcula marina]
MTGFDRRSYLALVLASTMAGCSLPEDESMPDQIVTDAASIADLAAGDVVAVANGLDRTAIRTDETETPVQDALDRVAERGGGRVYLPPGLVRERGPVRPHPNTGVYGFGMNVSVLQITESGTDGIRFDRDTKTQRVQLDGFELRGPGLGVETGVALHFVSNPADPATDPADFYVGRLYCREWANSVYRVDSDVGPFQCRHDFLRMDDCDAGNENGLLEWRSSYGPANRFGTVVAYPTASRSGANTDLLYQRGGELAVGDITTGGTSGTLVDTRAGRLHVGRLHYEPERQPSVPRTLVRIGGGATRFDDVVVDAGAVGYVYELGAGAGNALLFGPPGGRGEVRRNVVNIAGTLDRTRRSWYFGRPAEVDVTRGSQTGSLRVLGTAGQGMG